jgi:3-oxoacyl-[acyl-carrier protein] reductase
LTPAGNRIGGLLRAFREKQDREIRFGRITRPDDIASAAVFLASNDTRWITGQVIITAGAKRM